MGGGGWTSGGQNQRILKVASFEGTERRGPAPALHLAKAYSFGGYGRSQQVPNTPSQTRGGALCKWNLEWNLKVRPSSETDIQLQISRVIFQSRNSIFNFYQFAVKTNGIFRISANIDKI
jgi:hypothetical protein